jgi:hypothetical protein
MKLEEQRKQQNNETNPDSREENASPLASQARKDKRERMREAIREEGKGEVIDEKKLNRSRGRILIRGGQTEGSLERDICKNYEQKRGEQMRKEVCEG